MVSMNYADVYGSVIQSQQPATVQATASGNRNVPTPTGPNMSGISGAAGWVSLVGLLVIARLIMESSGKRL
jgi:hypothetical protein